MRSPQRLGIDRIEVRRRNLIAKSEMPYTRPLATLGTDVVLDSGDYAGLLDKALAALKWDDAAARPAPAPRRPANSSARGLAIFVEKSGLGPFDGVRSVGRQRRPRRGGDRRRVGRAGGRDRGGANLRRCARRRLRARARDARPHRPDRVRAGRVRVARDGDDRRGDAARSGRGAPQGDRGRGRSCCSSLPTRSTSSTAR